MNKSKIFALLLFSTLFFTFTSCDKDDDNDTTQQENQNVDETADQGVTVSGKVGNYTYVDLGLPSGTKWATYNVGASKPSECGGYFAWGETEPKEDYSSETYKWRNGSDGTLTKYCADSEFGAVDSLSTLLAEDDAATANWGSGWRMPTLAEQKELLDGCNWEWTYHFNGSEVAGYIGTSKTNGNTIFLPTVGLRDGTDLYRAGDSGYTGRLRSARAARTTRMTSSSSTPTTSAGSSATATAVKMFVQS